VRVMRVFSGVVFGYLLFELLWRGVFRVTDTDPHAPASISFEFGAVICGMLFALLAGYVASFIGGRPHFNAAWIAGGLVALTAVAIMMTKVVAWPQMVQLFFMAPAVVVGGWTYVLLRRAKTDGDSQ
jgi:fructose-specific phosphotransferase system IIC component